IPGRSDARIGRDDAVGPPRRGEPGERLPPDILDPQAAGHEHAARGAPAPLREVSGDASSYGHQTVCGVGDEGAGRALAEELGARRDVEVVAQGDVRLD